jgi:hypothetical protein
MLIMSPLKRSSPFSSFLFLFGFVLITFLAQIKDCIKKALTSEDDRLETITGNYRVRASQRLQTSTTASEELKDTYKVWPAVIYACEDPDDPINSELLKTLGTLLLATCLSNKF